MTTMQVVGALCMMLSGVSIGMRCAMGFMARYGWEHRPVLLSLPMAAFAGILFTRGLTAIQNIQPLTPWGETVAMVGSLWFCAELIRSFLRGRRRGAITSTRQGVLAAPLTGCTPDELRRLRTH